MQFKSVIQRAEFETRDLDSKLPRDETIFDKAREELEIISHIKHDNPLAHEEHAAHMALKLAHLRSEERRYGRLKSMADRARRAIAELDYETNLKVKKLDKVLNDTVTDLETRAERWLERVKGLEAEARRAREVYEMRKAEVEQLVAKERARQEAERVLREEQAKAVIDELSLADGRYA